MSVTDSTLAASGAHPTMKDRTFGLVLGTVCLIAGAGPRVFGHPFRPVFLVASTALLGAALTIPVLLHWPKRGWLAVTSRIGQVVQWLLMAILFYLVVTPVAIAMTLLGRDPLKRHWEPSCDTYWESRRGGTDMKQQF